MNKPERIQSVFNKGLYKACRSAYRMAFNPDRFDYSYGGKEAWLEALRDVDYYLRKNMPDGVTYYGAEDDFHTADVFLSHYVHATGGDVDPLSIPYYDRKHSAKLVSEYLCGFISKHVFVQCVALLGCKRLKRLVERMSVNGKFKD